METPIITGVLDDDVFGRNIAPQMHDAPPHRKLRMRTVQGPLVLRIADDATPDLVESLLAPKSTAIVRTPHTLRNKLKPGPAPPARSSAPY